MATIVTRAGKGSPLTHNEVDANFENLNSNKVETSSVSAFGATLIDDADAATARTTLGLGTAATTASTDYATAAQGALADSAVQPNDSPTFGSITVTGTVDGRDVAADGAKLDGIEAGADVTDTANVTAAGALMDSELSNITAVKALDQGVATTDSPSFAGLTVDTDTLYVDATNNRVGVGTATPAYGLDVNDPDGAAFVRLTSSDTGYAGILFGGQTDDLKAGIRYSNVDDSLRFMGYNYSERMRLDASGNVTVGTTQTPSVLISASVATGVGLDPEGFGVFTRSGAQPLFVNRLTNDGQLISFRQAGVAEGSINVSGTTVSLAGGHLSRWSRLPDGTDDSNILKGTVMTNLNEKIVWDGEENEQLNYTTVSSVEGDKDVAGLFVDWDKSDEWGDYFIAMTGDMIIRIAAGTTVERGDLLMSAGDGTAKPQGDDIVRSKTIAKVISTETTFTYEDGSFCVPCVVMAC